MSDSGESDIRGVLFTLSLSDSPESDKHGGKHQRGICEYEEGGTSERKCRLLTLVGVRPDQSSPKVTWMPPTSVLTTLYSNVTMVTSTVISITSMIEKMVTALSTVLK